VHPLDEVLLVVDASHAPLFVRSAELLADLPARLAWLSQAAEVVRLAKDAYKANDPALMRRLYEDALMRGGSEKELGLARKQLLDLEKRPRTPVEAVRRKILAREAELAAEVAAAVEAADRAGLGDARPAVQRRVMDVLRSRGRRRDEIAALLRPRLPAWIPAPEPFDPDAWIDVIDALASSRARPVVPPKGETPEITRQQRELGAALHTWRKDLVGFETDQLVVITPLARPERIATCVSMGELVCSALESIFAGSKHVRTDPWPLIMLLYETKEEYKKFSEQSGAYAGDQARLEWTAGHFDPMAGVARIFLPPTHDGFAQVMSTYAHELTHHWIDQRCPLWTSAELRSTSRTRGHWIVEGFATFVEEFRWDLARRTFDVVDPRAASLDVVGNARPEQLHPWETFYAGTDADFGRLDPKHGSNVPRRWQLNWQSVVSPLQMYYMQAAATCHYLWHEGGAMREGLFRFLVDHYTDRVPEGGDPVQARLGISSAELGARVLAHARATLARKLR
jgi:hypothetical protein